MSVSHDAILKSALSLSEADRILSATELLDSVDEPMPVMSIDDPKLLEELKRRASDPTSGVPWSEVKKILDEKLNR